MRKLLTQAFFVIPLLAVVTAPILDDRYKFMSKFNDFLRKENVQAAKSSSDTNLSYSKPKMRTVDKGETRNLSYLRTGDKYAMAEPFALKLQNKDAYPSWFPFSFPNMESVNYAMQKMMDPNTMTQLMAMMMNPQDVTVEAMCVTCHTGEDIARYQTYYGPMLNAMWAPFQTAMNPATYTGMMGMADPMAGYGGMGANNPMFNPAMWMNPMTYMNMMGPMMGMNPSMVMATPGSYATTPKVMSPEEYKNWYESQQKAVE